MNEKIIRHVEGLFENAPRTRRTFELRDELIANLNDRYNDLIAEGKDKDTAYSVVIEGIGDIDELIRGLREQEVFDPVQAQMQRQKSALLISTAVGFYFLGFIISYVLNQLGGRASETIGNVLALICFAFATIILVYNANSKPKYVKAEDTIVEDFKEFTSVKRKNDAAQKSIISLVPMFAVILFFILGFGFNLWHPGWMVFLLIPVAIQIIRLVGIYRGDD